jgi:hypothetical protein
MMHLKTCHLAITCVLFSIVPAMVNADETSLQDPYAIEPDKAIRPTQVINLLDEEVFGRFVFHLDERRSISMNPSEIWKLLPTGELQLTGKAMGYVRTDQAYRDYRLVLEYKWGDETYGRRVDAARDCGLLLHCFGPDGGFNQTYMSSIEAQLIEGGTGDFLVLAARINDEKYAPTSMTARVREDRDGEPVWHPEGELRKFPPPSQQAARINCSYRSPDWTDTKGFRASTDVEVPHGQWNRLEAVCEGDTIQLILNGQVVNEGSQCYPSSGYIAMQTELADCVIRKFEICPLDSVNR